MLLIVIGVGIGAALGGLVGLVMRCSKGTCRFLSTPGRGAFFGGIFGLVFALYFGAPYSWRAEGDSKVVQLTAATFDETIAGDRPVVVVFYSDACPPCHRLAPRAEKLAKVYTGRVTVARVNAEAEEALADRFGISAVPTVIYFAGGEAVGATQGLISYGAFRERVEKLIAEHAAAPKSLPSELMPANEGPTELDEPSQ